MAGKRTKLELEPAVDEKSAGADPQAKRPKISLESHTLYINNLNDKINLKTTKHLLYLLFSTYGDVVDIVLNLKRKNMRGQAHIVYGNVQSSALALKALQKFEFYNKPLNIAYANKVSRVVADSIEEQED